MAIGIISIGEINVHNRQWLRYSSHDSPEVGAMKDACDELGLEQLVRSPTREGHLLDLVVTDITGVKVQTLPAISHHKLIIAELKFKTPESTTVNRTVWQYQKADWERMRHMLTEADWSFLKAETHTMEHNNSMTSSFRQRHSAYQPKHYMNESRRTHG